MTEPSAAHSSIDEVVAWLSPRAASREPVALAVSPNGYALAVNPASTQPASAQPEGDLRPPSSASIGAFATWPEVCRVSTDDTAGHLAHLEATISPRWVWWDRATASQIARLGLRLGRCWDVVAVQALLVGGGGRSPSTAWCALRGLDPDAAPTLGQMTLIPRPASPSGRSVNANPLVPDAEISPPAGPPQPTESAGTDRLSDGYLPAEWTADPTSLDLDAAGTWAATAAIAAATQRAIIASSPDANRLLQTAHAESAAELLSAELAHDGLPFDTDKATRIIEAAAGPRPSDDADEERLRAARDAEVLALVPPGRPVDLRSPEQVREVLRRIEVDLPDTRAWRLREVADRHPLVPALLQWRKAERLSNTYGYQWMDTHVEGRRLRGEWTAYDGAAGRMTASAGLHNLPAELRPAVTADEGFTFVRADLGQIEPRVLAAVSGDEALIAATRDDDLYQPIADRLRVERSIAKIAVLGAMYGSTTGEAANALRGLDRAYPVAMAFLNEAASDGRQGRTVHTVGGRPVHMWGDAGDGNLERAAQLAAARGRFARNAVIQGAAAEFFKMWAVTVRARAAEHGATVVLCLHDELLVHTPAATANAVADVVDRAVEEVAARWSPSPGTRFVADTTVIDCWADAK